MALTSSLYSGVAGLVNQGTAMQVIGDNISNVNTMGFKAARATFQDIMAQAVNTARSGSQVGRGSAMADVQSLFAQGSFESTASPTDLAIAGNGFFILSDPKTENSVYYTRAGQFSADQYGYLVNPAGLRAQGWAMETQPNGQAEIVGAIGDIQINTSSPPVETSQVTVTTNLDSRITDPVSDNSLAVDWVANSGNLTANVNYQYKTTVNVFDSLGNTHELTIYFDRTHDEREWEFLVTMNPTDDRSGITGAQAGMLMRGYITFTPQGQIDQIYSKYVTGIDGLGTFVDGAGAPTQLRVEDVELASATNPIPVNIDDGTGTVTAYNIIGYDPATDTLSLDSDGDFTTVEASGVMQTNKSEMVQRFEPELTSVTFDQAGTGGGPYTIDTSKLQIKRDALFDVSPQNPIQIDSANPWYIIGYDNTTGTVTVADDPISPTQTFTDGSFTTAGDWFDTTYGSHNYPELKAYFLPPTGPPVDQVTGYDPSAQLIEMDFGASPETVTRDPNTGDYSVSRSWKTEAITTTQYANSSNTLFYDQNGFGAGFLESVSVDSQGVISGSYSNGRIVALAQVGLARFNSPTDLSREGGNLWRQTTSSGAPVTGQPGSNGLGTIASNALEQSTVDIGTEFVRLITTQRAFQANSRLITTTDDMLSELLNMKR